MDTNSQFATNVYYDRTFDCDAAKILQSEEFRTKLAQQGMVPVGNTPAEFAAAIREESARWAKVIKERGLVAN